MTTSPTAGATSSSVGFSKDLADVIVKRPSFASSLKTALEGGGAAQPPGVKRGGGWLLKQSTTGRWAKRWFVVHGHYLTYFKDDVAAKKGVAVPSGTLDLWHVEGVTLEDTVLSLILSETASEARREEMGSRTVRTARETVNKNKGPFAGLVRVAAKRLEQVRRGDASPRMILKADTSSEAQLWLSAMKESPFMGQLARLTSESSSQTDQPSEGPMLKIAELRIHMQGNRQLIYQDAQSLFDGATSIMVRNIPQFGGKISVKAVSLDGQAEETVAAPFEPALSDASGKITIPLVHLQKGSSAVVNIEWKRHYANRARAMVYGLVGVVITFLSCVVLGLGFTISLVTSLLVGAGIFFTTYKQQMEQNNAVITDVTTGVAESQIKSIASSTSVTSPTTPKTGTTTKKKGASAISTVGVTKSVDLNITLEESAMMAQLREKLKDMWPVKNDEADAFIKKYGKIMEEWGADMNALKDPAKRKRTLDKQILSDFRFVRFLRARKHNMDKAEQMARDALQVRIAFGFDELHEGDFKPPQWMIAYNASTIVAPLLKLDGPDTEARFTRFWLRDREGHLCMFLRNGRMNSRKVFKKTGSNATYLIKCLIWAAELLRHDLETVHAQTKGKVESVITAVIDLEGFSVSEQIPLGDLLGIARRWFPILSVSFPELLCRVLVFNAPWLFGSLWSAMKPFIPEEVLEKIQIHSGAVNVEKHIRPYISNEHIPAYLGGSLYGADSDPFVSDRLPPRGPYLSDHGEELLAGVDPDCVTRKKR